MKLTLKIWRQKNAQDQGKIVEYKVDNVSPDMSFLEMLDVLNEDLVNKNEDPVAFDHDCREGICGMCSLFIMDKHMDQTEESLHVSYTCARLKTEIRFLSSRSERKHSRLLKTWWWTEVRLKESSMPEGLSL